MLARKRASLTTLLTIASVVIFVVWCFLIVPDKTRASESPAHQKHHRTSRASKFISKNDGAKPRVLVTHATLLAPHRKGGDVYILGVIMAYQQMGYDVTFAYPMRRFDDHHHKLEDIGVRVIGPLPSSSQILKSHLETFKYELVVEFLWNHLEHLAFLRDLNQIVKQASPATGIVVVSPDLNHERFTPVRMAREDQEAFLRRTAFFREKILDTETFFWSRAEVGTCVNMDICKRIHELYPEKKLQLQPFYQHINSTRNTETTWSERTGIIYFGYDNEDNKASLSWLVQNVVPSLFTKHGGTLHVYGSVQDSGCSATLGCVYHGSVADGELAAAISSARWMVAPIFRNVGISTKILKSLGIGTPVVTTLFGLGGMEHIERKKIPIITARASSNETSTTTKKQPDFATTLDKIYDDRRLWKSLHDRSPPFVQKYFGLSTVVDANREIVHYLRKLWKKQKRSSVVETPHASDVYTHKKNRNRKKTLSVAWDINHDASSYARISNIFAFLDSSGGEVTSYQGCPVGKSSTVDVFVRMRWPVNFERPVCCPRHVCKFVLYQPWEMGYIPESWVPQIKSNVDSVWTLTSFNSRMFEKSGVDPAMVRSVPFGVNCTTLQRSATDLRAQLGISRSTKVFAYIGGALSRKGIDILLDAYTLAFTREKDDVLLLLKITYQHGGVGLIHEMKAMARDKSLPKIMILDGGADHDMGDVYRAIDVLVHPARAEGLGLTPMEALAAGKVVIAPDRGATNDYLSPGFAYLIPSEMEQCSEYPCQDDSLCVFPMADGSSFEACERLVKPPEWLSMDPYDLAQIMEYVFSNFETAKEYSHEGTHFVCDNFQWNNIADIVKAELYRAVYIGTRKTQLNPWHDPLPALVSLGGSENYFVKEE